MIFQTSCVYLNENVDKNNCKKDPGATAVSGICCWADKHPEAKNAMLLQRQKQHKLSSQDIRGYLRQATPVGKGRHVGLAILFLPLLLLQRKATPIFETVAFVGQDNDDR